MNGRVRLIASFQGGVTVPEILESRVPLAMRITGRRGPVLNVSMLNTGAGYFEDDLTSVEIEVGKGASVCVSTPGASIAFRCAGRGSSRADVRVKVRRGGFLAWLPEPLIAAEGCSHLGQTTIDLEEEAAALWREELCAGRTGETGGRLELSLLADLGGHPLLRDAIVFGREGWIGPRTLDGHRFTGTVALLGRRLQPGPGVMQLARPGSVVRAVAPDALSLRRTLDQVTGVLESIPEVYSEQANGKGQLHISGSRLSRSARFDRMH